jgi:hypothetical protein
VLNKEPVKGGELLLIEDNTLNVTIPEGCVKIDVLASKDATTVRVMLSFPLIYIPSETSLGITC